MKQIYTSLLCITLLAAMAIPMRSQGQCTCSGGTPAQLLQQNQNLSGTLPFNNTLQFDKFDPTVGTLTCLTLSGTVTTSVSMDLVNRDTTARIDYALTYTRVTTLSGPGVSVSKSVAKDYGPFNLGRATYDPDTTVHMGPDVLFNNAFLTKSSTNVVGYIGAPGAKVNITYFNNGSFLMTQGNDNYGLDVAASSIVSVTLNYYYCPNAILANSIRSFNLLRNNRTVDLVWQTDNDVAANTYSVEFSRNGVDFTAIDQRSAAGTGSHEYGYRYSAPQGETGKLYFRVKMTDSKGATYYTAIRTASFTENGTLSSTVYPNPAGRNVQVQFESLQTGTLEVDLVNTMGQVLEHSTHQVNKAATLPVQFSAQPAKGMYWLRVGNRQTGERSVTRLTIL
jgi:Secretion system C-terminal sorting domain